jgi:K+-transporting ATPase ATPase C chain
LAAGVRKSRCQPTNGLKLPDQHRGRRRGGLTDLIERELGEAFQPHRRHPYPKPAAHVVPVPFERGPLGQREQCVGKPVNAGNAGEGIVDRGRQRANRDLNHLRDAKLAVLGERAVTPDANSSVISLTLLTGCIFPLVLFALGRLLYPSQAAGSLVTRDGEVIGSRLIGQDFTRPEYFHPRPSAAGAGYDGTSSGGTNFSPSNGKFLERVRQWAEDYRRSNGLPPDAPVSIDPNISPENAALQVPRVARARGLSEDVVRRLLARHTQGRQLGFMGKPRVSVFDLNLALDQAASLTRR